MSPYLRSIQAWLLQSEQANVPILSARQILNLLKRDHDRDPEEAAGIVRHDPPPLAGGPN
jgi:hypothetical protein